MSVAAFHKVEIENLYEYEVDANMKRTQERMLISRDTDKMSEPISPSHKDSRSLMLPTNEKLKKRSMSASVSGRISEMVQHKSDGSLIPRASQLAHSSEASASWQFISNNFKSNIATKKYKMHSMKM